MAHHTPELPERNEIQPVMISEKAPHPFFEKNDLTYLSMIKPLLSQTGQKLISFFVNFGEEESRNNNLDFNGLLKQFTSKLDPNTTKDFLPALMTMMSGSDNKNSFNPAMLTALMSMMAAKKED
jgi:hypothetical protein